MLKGKYFLGSLLTMLLFGLVFYACTDDLQTGKDEISSEEDAIEAFMKEFNNRIGDYQEVEGQHEARIKDFMQSNMSNEKSGLSACEDTPNCPKTTKTGTFVLNSTCSFDYSYEIYDCGNDNYGIFNFQITPSVGSTCTAWDDLVVQNYNDNDFTQYQYFYNNFLILVLSEVEDDEYAAGTNNTGQTLIASYIPNICAVTCPSIPSEQEHICGEDCCIRFAIYNNTTLERSTSVFSTGECGGEIVSCPGGQTTSECKNFDCPNLQLYR